MGKCMQMALEDLFPHIAEVHHRKRKATVHAGKLGVAIKLPEGHIPPQTSIHWSNQVVVELGLD